MTGKKETVCVSFTFDGKRRYCYGSTKAEAEEKAEKRRKKLEKESHFKFGSPTLDEYFEMWEENRRGTIRDSTERTVRERYKGISLLLGERKLREIDRQSIIDLQHSLSKRNYSSTTNAVITLLRCILNEAVNDRLLEWNPCNGVKALKRTEIPARESIHRALTKEETRSFFEHAKESWYFDMYRFLIYSGLRCGEAAALNREDLKEGYIDVRRTVIRKKCGARVGEDTKTSAGQREIPYTYELKEIVSHQLAMNRAQFRGKRKKMNGPLFLSKRGGLVTSDYLDNDIMKICEKAGIEPFTAHAFRDTFATRAIESGMNPKTLQVILGHSSYGITMSLYVHVMPATKAEEMGRIMINID